MAHHTLIYSRGNFRILQDEFCLRDGVVGDANGLGQSLLRYFLHPAPRGSEVLLRRVYNVLIFDGAELCAPSKPSRPVDLKRNEKSGIL